MGSFFIPLKDLGTAGQSGGWSARELDMPFHLEAGLLRRVLQNSACVRPRCNGVHGGGGGGDS